MTHYKRDFKQKGNRKKKNKKAVVFPFSGLAQHFHTIKTPNYQGFPLLNTGERTMQISDVLTTMARKWPQNLWNIPQEVALYLSSTSNHNAEAVAAPYAVLRYIFLLHQTTTVTTSVACVLGCVISFFYIKPQPYNESFGDLQVALYLSSTSNHNVLTQQKKRKWVALYLSSTSNHNWLVKLVVVALVALYLSSTSNHNAKSKGALFPYVALYLSSTSNHNRFYHIVLRYWVALYLSSTSNHNKYAKLVIIAGVALYLSSTSNHNTYEDLSYNAYVALYLSSTSNHNAIAWATNRRLVALYLSSTSNHNSIFIFLSIYKLRYIFLLHQTTTNGNKSQEPAELRYIFLLHQTTTLL